MPGTETRLFCPSLSPALLLQKRTCCTTLRPGVRIWLLLAARTMPGERAQLLLWQHQQPPRAERSPHQAGLSLPQQNQVNEKQPVTGWGREGSLVNMLGLSLLVWRIRGWSRPMAFKLLPSLQIRTYLEAGPLNRFLFGPVWVAPGPQSWALWLLAPQALSTIPALDRLHPMKTLGSVVPRAF